MFILHDHLRPPMPSTSFEDFLKVEKGKKPAYTLLIDFGQTNGSNKISAQITQHYRSAGFAGKQFADGVNFPPRQIGNLMSGVLPLGFSDEKNHVVLFSPDQAVPNDAQLN